MPITTPGARADGIGTEHRLMFEIFKIFVGGKDY